MLAETDDLDHRLLIALDRNGQYECLKQSMVSANIKGLSNEILGRI
jgi:hypothetical protein